MARVLECELIMQQLWIAADDAIIAIFHSCALWKAEPWTGGAYNRCR